MKKAYFILIFAFCSLFADVKLDTFVSNAAFKDITTYQKPNNDYSISYSSTVPITKNLRFYFPKNTKSYSIRFSRQYSQGAIYLYLSLNAIPNYINKQNQYIGTVPDNLSASNIYYAIQLDIMPTLANPTNTIYYPGVSGINARGNTTNEFTNQGKWLYVRQDNRNLTATSTRELVNIHYSIILTLDGTKVNQDAELIGLGKFPDCQNKGDLKHICTFIKSHGANGADNTFASNAQTSEGLNENLVQTTSIAKNISSKWNLIGPHSMSAYSVSKNFTTSTNISNIKSFSNDADPYWLNWKKSNGDNFYSVAPKKAMFVYADTTAVANFFQPVTYQSPTTLTLSLVNGWNLVSTDRAINITSNTAINACVDAMYKYNPTGNPTWYTYDKSKNKTTLSLAQNDGFWIKTNKACNITIQ